MIEYCSRPVQEYFTRLCRDVTIADEGLQNLHICASITTRFKEGGVFIVPYRTKTHRGLPHGQTNLWVLYEVVKYFKNYIPVRGVAT